ncbi:hypothetical protein [Halobacterium hubeiense]|uniref:hypothetical protein n=1 Tax=Halobacterium hubeiense TaxID=1407499 RepID=UPI00117B9B83|nr:hypothetical protein [Halobacterium hubeiense]
MMDEGPDQELLPEWITERDFNRREVIGGTIALFTGIGWWCNNQFPTAGNTNARLSEAEKSAATAAERVNVIDLRDPLLMSGLTLTVERAIESINDVLHDGTVTYGVWIAEKQRQFNSLLSTIPGVASPPTESRPAKRLARLEAVLPYYRSLDDVLHQVASTQRILATIEDPALYDGERPDQPPSNFVDIDSIDAANKAAKSAGERAAREENADSLLPDTEQVASQINLQARIQQQHSTAIQSYLDSAERFESGARKHEQGQMDQAESQFRAAKESIPDDILESELPYAISHHGPTLRDYATHFTKRRQGINRLIEACESGVDSSTQNVRFNKGLSHLIDARDVVSL